MSYVFFDPQSRQAAVIDPRMDLVDEYRSFMAERGLKPVIALDTHTHADHFSATHILRESGAEIGVYAGSRSQRATRKLSHGETVAVGAYSLKTLYTPGHTDDSISFAGEGVVFTGDTLLIGSTGRTDFPTADPGAQFDSLHRVLAELPESTIVFPGHDYSDLLFSTIGVEKAKNSHWKITSREAFIKAKKDEKLHTLSEDVKKRVEFNLSSAPSGYVNDIASAAACCATALPDAASVGSINVEKFAHKITDRAPGIGFIDVREPDEFAEAHIAHLKNIPLSELAQHLQQLRALRRVYVSCLSGRRSLLAANTLSYVGLNDVVNVTGGFKAWQNAGLPVMRRKN